MPSSDQTDLEKDLQNAIGTSTGRAAVTRTAVLWLLAAVVLWSAWGIAVKSVALAAAPLLCITSGASFLAQFAIHRRLPRRPTLFSLCCFGVSISMTMTSVLSTQLTTAANAILLQFCSPVIAAAIGFALHGAIPPRRDVYGMLGVVFGIALLFCDSAAEVTLVGNLIGLFSGFAVAAYTTMLNRIRERPPQEITLMNSFFTFACLLPFVHPGTVSQHDFLITTTYGACAGMGWYFYSRAVAVLSPTAALILLTPEAVLNPLLVALVIGEFPGILGITGGAVILLTVTSYAIISSRSVRQTAAIQQAACPA